MQDDVKKAREKQILRDADERLRAFARMLAVDVKQQLGRKPGNPLPQGDLFRLPAFKGSYKVPGELLKAYLQNQGAADELPTTAARHAFLIPVALEAVGAVGEVVSAKVWNRPLEAYQLDPMRSLLRSKGYAPASTDNTLSKLRKLVLHGKPEAATTFKQHSFGEGSHRVYFVGEVVHYRGESRTMQKLGERIRVKVDKRLISLWSWLADSVSKTDRAKVVELIRAAEFDARCAAEYRQDAAQLEDVFAAMVTTVSPAVEELQ